MPRQFVSPLIFTYFTALSALTASAEENIELFRQFLDDSPSLNATTLNPPLESLVETVREAPVRAVQPLPGAIFSPRQPLLVAAAPPSLQSVLSPKASGSDERPKPNKGITVLMAMPEVDQAAPRVSNPDTPVEPEAVDASVVMTAERQLRTEMSQPAPPKPPIARPAVPATEPEPLAELQSGSKSGGVANAGELAHVEHKVRESIASLQRLLEAEEKKLTSQMSLYAKQRHVALDKNDEQRLEQIEEAEQMAVTHYERRIQQLISTALPQATTNVRSNPEHGQQLSKSHATYRVPTSSVTPTITPTSSNSLLRKRTFSTPSPSQMTTLRHPNAPRKRFSDSTQTKSQLVSPEGPGKANASQEIPPQRIEGPSKPPKKRFRLWPFR